MQNQPNRQWQWWVGEFNIFFSPYFFSVSYSSFQTMGIFFFFWVTIYAWKYFWFATMYQHEFQIEKRLIRIDILMQSIHIESQNEFTCYDSSIALHLVFVCFCFFFIYLNTKTVLKRKCNVRRKYGFHFSGRITFIWKFIGAHFLCDLYYTICVLLSFMSFQPVCLKYYGERKYIDQWPLTWLHFFSYFVR